MTNAIQIFTSAITKAGLIPPTEVYADGLLHRFNSDGKKGDEAGWYVLHNDGIPAGVFGCWRKGITQNWCIKPIENLSLTERENHLKCIESMRQKREAEKQRLHEQSAKKALERWEKATPADDSHPYLVSKGIKAHGLRFEGENLLVRIFNIKESRTTSLQTFSPIGDKFFMPGGAKKGGIYQIGDKSESVVICEGFATAASIHEATGLTVAVAFDANNLLPVAEAIRAKLLDLKLIIAADDDWKSEVNTGVTKAKEAAHKVGGYLAVPNFPNNRGEKDSDFNDMARLYSLESVKACIENASKVTKETPNEWPEPSPLPNELPPVKPFDPELLPEALRGWVADIAYRMNIPPDFSAVGVVVALSSLIGARAVVAPKQKDDWRVVPNLWGLIVGRPGVMKSPALSEALKPLNLLEKNLRTQYEKELEKWNMDCLLAGVTSKINTREAEKYVSNNPDKARDLLIASQLPEKPHMRRYVVIDSTVEALQDTLIAHPWGLLVYRDELHGLLASMDKQGHEQARGFYLQGYDGNQGYTVDRIIRGKNHHVERVCLAMLGGIQPGKIQKYVRDAVVGGVGDDGLLQRFGLAVWPDMNRDWVRVDQWPNRSAKQEALTVFERFNNLPNEQQEWKFSPEAQDIYWEWVEPLERELRGDELHPALTSHLAKYRKLVPALALIFAMVDTPNSNRLIHRDELLRALAWSEYLRSHAERIYAAAIVPETTGAKLLIEKIKSGKLVDGDGVLMESFTPRMVYGNGWTGLGTSESVRNAADLLADYGYLLKEIVPSGAHGGRPSDRYLINPKLFQGGK